jgi:hypothetical protein
MGVPKNVTCQVLLNEEGTPMSERLKHLGSILSCPCIYTVLSSFTFRIVVNASRSLVCLIFCVAGEAVHLVITSLSLSEVYFVRSKEILVLSAVLLAAVTEHHFVLTAVHERDTLLPSVSSKSHLPGYVYVRVDFLFLR